MEETKRQQTTKGRQSPLRYEAPDGYINVIGIWMCRGKDMNVMVMDVEGTDGRERGEDQVRASSA